MTEKIIIDTDPGIDDLLAILLAAASPQLDIQAVTTVAGNTTLDNVTANARFAIDLTLKDIPLFGGSSKPLKKALVTANVHGATGLAGANVKPLTKYSKNGVDQIITLARKYPNQITIVAIGPETNIAKAFLKDPELPKLLKQLVIMGGAIDVAGNKNRVAEFNVFVDPDAAKIVFDAPVKKVLVPLDICNITPLFMEDFEEFKGSRLYQTFINMVKPYIKAIKRFEGQEGALVYDALAVYYLINPDAFETKMMDVRVETKGELTSGMTVADKRTWGTPELNIQVVCKLDRNIFVNDFINLIKGL